MRKRKVSTAIAERWQPVALFAGAALLLGGLFGFGMSAIAPGILPEELSVLNIGADQILRSPLYLHQQIFQKLVHALGGSDLLSVRLASILTGVLAVLMFYLIVKAWFTRRIALFGSIMLATSSWFLHVVRLGTPDASYLLLTVPVFALILLKANKYSLWGALLLLLSGVVLLYIPGLVWLIVPALVWRRKLLLQTVRNLSPAWIGVISLCIVFGLLPLIIGSVQNPRLLLEIAGLPAGISSISAVPGQLLSGLKEVFITRDSNAVFGIARLPYIDIATSVLVFLGLVYAFQDRKLDRMKVIAIITATGFVLHGLSLGAVSLVFVLPFIYFFAVCGLVYLLRKWLTVFPKNPLAEKVALFSVMVLLLSISYYHTTRYFVAWPHSDGHAKIFQQSKE